MILIILQTQKIEKLRKLEISTICDVKSHGLVNLSSKLRFVYGIALLGIAQGRPIIYHHAIHMVMQYFSATIYKCTKCIIFRQTRACP